MNRPPPLPQAPKPPAQAKRSWFRISLWYTITLVLTGSLSTFLHSQGMAKSITNVIGMSLFLWALCAPWRQTDRWNVPGHWWHKKPMRLSRQVWWLGLFLTAAFPLLRLYQFSSPPSDTAVNAALSYISQLSAFSLGLVITGLQLLSDPIILLASSLVVGALFLLGRRQHTQNGQLPTWFYSLAILGLMITNPVLDMHPDLFVAQVLIIGLTLANSRGNKQGPALALRGFYLVATVFLLLFLERQSHGHILPIVGIVFTIYASYIFSGIRAQRIERKLSWVLVGVAVTQTIASVAPSLTGPAGSPYKISDSAAYGYCTAYDSQHTVWMTFPECSAFPQHREPNLAHESCRAGTVQAFDLQSDDPIIKHKHAPFSPDYFGRLEKPICLENGLVIGMTDVVIGGDKHGGSTLRIEKQNGHVSQEHLLGTNAGHTLAFDPIRNWIYAVDEFSNTVQRFSTESQQVEPFGPHLENQSLTIDGQPISQNRNSIFISEHYFGKEVIELSLKDGQEKMRYLHNNGGGWAATVDDSDAKLYVTGMWSLDVFDLRTGQHLKRHRTGFGARAPVVSKLHGHIFIPMTLEGTIRAYDRTTLARTETYPVGLGVRNLFVTGDEQRLLGTNTSGTYYWFIDTFRGTRQP